MTSHKKIKKLRRTHKKGRGLFFPHDRSSLPKSTAAPPPGPDPKVEEEAKKARKAAADEVAKKALDAQAKRKAAAAAQEDPSRRSSTASQSEELPSSKENPLEKLRGRKTEVSDNFKGTVQEPESQYRFFGVQRDKTEKKIGSKRKSRRPKTRRRR
jgi:hypothetical protein